MIFEPDFDLITIASPVAPSEQALSRWQTHEYTLIALREIRRRTNNTILYSKVSRNNAGVTLRHSLHWHKAFIENPPVAILTFNAGNYTPASIRQLVIDLFGTTTGMKVTYLECRIDVYGATFETIAKRLLVQGKSTITQPYKTTIYYGSGHSAHSICLYDKQLQLGIGPPRIRIESRFRFTGQARPNLEDILNGNWNQSFFRGALLLDNTQLPLTREEKINLTKQGATRFFMKLSRKRKELLLKLVSDLAIDLDYIFYEWLQEWWDFKENPP